MILISFLKITILGAAAVGKTSLRRRFMGEGFQRNYSMTIGADFSVYKMDRYILHIWDLAGQMRFGSIIQQYYAGSVGSIIVFDITRPESFENLDQWIKALIDNNKRIVPIMLLGNKADLRGSEPDEISMEDAEDYAEALTEWSGIKVTYVEASALSGLNVDTAFVRLVREIEIQRADRTE